MLQRVLQSFGIDGDDCNLRFYHAETCEQDWQAAKAQIEKCYQEYLDRTKDELLARMKALRQAFIQRNCCCSHKCCECCWVEKNYWEHCGIPEP